MNVSTHTTRRLASLTGLAAVVAALAVPTALARPATDPGDDMSRTPVVLDLRSPDTHDVTTQALGGVDPAIATAMAAHQRRVVAGDFRSPDTRDVTVNPIAPVLRRARRLPRPQTGPTGASSRAMFGGHRVSLLARRRMPLGLSGHGKRHGTVKPA